MNYQSFLDELAMKGYGVQLTNTRGDGMKWQAQLWAGPKTDPSGNSSMWGIGIVGYGKRIQETGNSLDEAIDKLAAHEYVQSILNGSNLNG